MTARQLSDGNEDGQVLGQSSTDLIAFYGATAVVRPYNSAIAAVSTSAPIGSSGNNAFGFASSAQAIALLNNVNAITSALLGLGLVAAS